MFCDVQIKIIITYLSLSEKPAYQLAELLGKKSDFNEMLIGCAYHTGMF